LHEPHETKTNQIIQAKKPSSSRAADQKAVDQAILAAIKKEEVLRAYLQSTWSLRKGDKPHEMVF
jgi:large subunit ribosomal protein L6e